MRLVKSLPAFFFVVFTFVASSAQQPPPDSWGPFSQWIGRWTGIGSGTPGQGLGTLDLKWDLERNIIVSRGHSEYPAEGTKPAVLHEQLMIISQSRASGLRAIYFDNEGHTIEYSIRVSSANQVQFLSVPTQNAPAFRLTYTAEAPDLLAIKFEIAAPDKPGIFQTYLEGRVRRAPIAPRP